MPLKTPEHCLAVALRGMQHIPVAHVAVLVTETGALECVERVGDPNLIVQTRTIEQDGIWRTFTYRYIRTDIRAQGGYRVYTLHEIDGGDFVHQETRGHRAQSADHATAGGRLHATVHRLSDEGGNDAA